ncbi:MAG: Fe-S cluster assembly protein SufD [Actinomycetota bacterium]|nr:Fe-S cluster assembly protein SufD [Actinomycetota bacterium]
MAAFERFAGAPLPTEAEEIWRYSRISQLDLDAYVPPAPDGASPPAGLPDELLPVLEAAGPRSGLLVLRDGRVCHRELDPELEARGVTLGPLAEAPDGEELLGAVADAEDPFVDLATAFSAEPVAVVVPRRVVVEHPILVVHHLGVGAAASAVFPRVVVRAGEAAGVNVLDHLESAPGVAALVTPVVELDVGDASHVGYLGVQELSGEAWQIGYQASRVGRDATLTSSVIALGGSYARVRADSSLTGQGGTSRLLAAYFGDGHQMHDFRTMQDHAAPKTSSDLLFKGAVEDEAHAVYSGLIRVRKGASGTNAMQTNRNLVLDEGARADSVPNLEIEENDVRCSHASAVGPVDEDQLYYLEARGVPREVAERLIVLGFFDDVIGAAPVPALRPRLRAAVAAKLTGAGA